MSSSHLTKLVRDCCLASLLLAQTSPVALADIHPERRQAPAEWRMTVGESRLLGLDGVRRVAIGDGRTATALVADDGDLMVTAHRVGATSLIIWRRDGRRERMRLLVQADETWRTAQDLVDYLASVPAVRARVVGERVIVEGEKLSDADRDKIAELARRYPQLVDFTQRIGWERMVVLDVKVVEFPSHVLRELGIRWQSGSQGGLFASAAGAIGSAQQIVPHGRLAGIFGIQARLDAQIALLAEKGEAAILAQPRLSARSGSSASFFAGGELPYQVSGPTGTPSVHFKPYGVKLDITPQVDARGGVRARVDTEVSSIDAASSTAHGAAFRVRRTRTEFNLQAGETMVLSGFISREQGLTEDKVPGLGDLPVLGALFRSERFRRIETELVVFVTPTVLESGSPTLAADAAHQRRRVEIRSEQSKTGAAADLDAATPAGVSPPSSHPPSVDSPAPASTLPASPSAPSAESASPPATAPAPSQPDKGPP